MRVTELSDCRVNDGAEKSTVHSELWEISARRAWYSVDKKIDSSIKSCSVLVMLLRLAIVRANQGLISRKRQETSYRYEQSKIVV